jgi:hypothetical protein
VYTLDKYTRGEDVDVDVGYYSNTEQGISDWKRNTAIKQSAGKSSAVINAVIVN